MKNLHIPLVGMVLFMLGLVSASVPLYKIFCQATGYGGTPRWTSVYAGKLVDRYINIEFSTYENRNIKWKFTQVPGKIRIKIGELGLVFFKVKNHSDKDEKGIAVYNVSPEKAAYYFNKVVCFCFNEQIIKANQEVEFPVQFFIDPEMISEKNLDDIKTIVLSYSIFPIKNNN
jgi:cytochrome c oxidase assembly protein subunit 11